MSIRSTLVAVACTLCGGVAMAEGDLQLQLARDIKFQKPAEFLYINTSGENAATAANVALRISTNLAALSKVGVTTDVGLIASFARNTISTTKTHKWAGTAELKSQFTTAERKDVRGATDYDIFTAFGTVTREEDRLADQSQSLYRVGGTFNSNHYLRFSTSENSKTRASLKLFPTVGFFQRSAGGTVASSGRIGGPYVYVLAKGSLGSVLDLAWFERLGFEASAQFVRPSWGSAATQAKSVIKLYDGSLTYNLATSDNAKWQPSISITRTVGADPILDEARRVQTVVGFRVSYGL